MERVRPGPLCCFRIGGARLARLPVCPGTVSAPVGRPRAVATPVRCLVLTALWFLVPEKVRLELGLQDNFV